ncbi:MAG: pyruvate, phosphate dikinase, partial [Thaumarchaeota archaeon]|nr:pyruvate, phosphate dikinase [Nitrososphaerota archaeon]
LAEMTSLGLPVPPGFVITTDVCEEFYRNGEELPAGLMESVKSAVTNLETRTGKKFGTPKNPLLVSVRSGAPISMPGMMDTILNLGLNDSVVEGLSALTGNDWFAYDTYRRFIQMFGKIVLGMGEPEFSARLEGEKKRAGVLADGDLDLASLKRLISSFKSIIEHSGKSLPQDPIKQLEAAIKAVFQSWNGKRALEYRKQYRITPEMAPGTAVTVGTMVFGNMGGESATGVLFTRSPETGTQGLYGDYLANSQGEDVVAGTRTPKPLAELQREMPGVYREIENAAKLLEKHYREPQDIEFTVERGKLYVLQTRAAKMGPAATVKAAVDLVREGVISKEEAVLRVAPEQLEQLLHPRVDPSNAKRPMVQGVPASPGAAAGKAVFDADTAVEWSKGGEKVILVREETKPEDVHGFFAARGILTSRGGKTCVGAETKILTNKGFLEANHAHDLFSRGEQLTILSYDHKSGRTLWRRVIDASRSRGLLASVACSQTGNSRANTIRITKDHKMYTFRDRELIKKPLSEVLKDGDGVCVVQKIPFTENPVGDTCLAYLVGAIVTDGHVRLTRTRGSVTFTQHPRNRVFIDTVRRNFAEIFSTEFTQERMKYSSGYFQGRKIVGQALDLICTRRAPALSLLDIKKDLVRWILDLDEESTLQFLAGAIDGDGHYAERTGRIHIYTSADLLEPIIVACLKLGIVPQVVRNRTIFNIQIVESVSEFLSRTKRARGSAHQRMYGTRLFSARQLLCDVIDSVNRGGKVKSYVKLARLIDARKIEQSILPRSSGVVRYQLERILDSDLRMHRVKVLGNEGEDYIYNFEVDAEHELDKNYVAFTSLYTPLLISNSHAAVVARGIGKPCIVGCSSIAIDQKARTFLAEGAKVKEGDLITIDGSSGFVYLGAIPLLEPEIKDEVFELLDWADQCRKLGVWANADTPEAAARSRKMGAEGIGLARTERMFNASDRLPLVVSMIMASSEGERESQLRKLEPLQKTDFKNILKVMEGLPVIIRLLDPPLHEFLPRFEDLLAEVAVLEKIGNKQRLEDARLMLDKARQLMETNPMLGHRGVRLGVTNPEIYTMQITAVLEAAAELTREGVDARPKVMVPQVSSHEEVKRVREHFDRVKLAVEKKFGLKLDVKFGTMIEAVRAVLDADEIARYVDFFSFGTNDLTQATFSFSREDAEGKFLPYYLENSLLPDNPFETLDEKGVVKLIAIAVELGRRTNPSLEVGICGEHGGDPRSIYHCHVAGLNYVSASSFRIPVARLAAAHAALKERQKGQ